MTNQQALTLAIITAMNNGWTFFDWIDDDDFKWEVTFDKEADSHSPLLVETTGIADYTWHPSIIIYDHDFAKALWGKGKTYRKQYTGVVVVIDNPNFWKARLRNMVVAKDPIKYLGEHV